MNRQITTHEEELLRLNRIEGQIRGVQKMIQDKRYCIDILTQLSSVVGAIKSVEENILERHLKGCVKQSFTKGNKEDRREIVVKADTLRASLSLFRVVLGKEKPAPFTAKDRQLRDRVRELYPHDRPTPFPWSFNSEPKFDAENIG